MSPELLVGLMSATGMDDIDAALVAFDNGRARLIHAINHP
jgi:1,6-anhydro-N-acetylmuramate kinase